MRLSKDRAVMVRRVCISILLVLSTLSGFSQSKEEEIANYTKTISGVLRGIIQDRNMDFVVRERDKEIKVARSDGKVVYYYRTTYSTSYNAATVRGQINRAFFLDGMEKYQDWERVDGNDYDSAFYTLDLDPMVPGGSALLQVRASDGWLHLIVTWLN